MLTCRLSQGVISVTSNLIPGLFSKMMHQRDPELNSNLQQLMAWPYVPLNRQKREEGARLLQQFQEHIPGCKGVQVLNDEDFIIVSKY